jgi:GTP-binding protein EngB required for normal cell division
VNEIEDTTAYVVKIGANAMAMATRLGHPTLAETLGELIGRVRDPLSRVVVCGGFKQGKSSLVNSLLNARVSPADPVVPTAVPLVVADGEAAAAVYLQVDGERAVSPIEAGQLADVLRGRMDEYEGSPVVGALVRTRRSLLERGVIIVDTPPITGGLASVDAVQVLVEIRRARAFVYVTDSSQELTAPEIEFIAAAHELCPSILVCQTKTDLYAPWERIRTLNESHLEAAGIAASVLPVSSTMRQRGVRLADPELQARSGYPALSSFLLDDVLARATRDRIRLLAETAARASAQMAEPVALELAALQQPSELVALRERAESTKRRVTAFASGEGSWERVLKRELRRINDDSRYHVQVALKELERWATERIEDEDPAHNWMEFEGRLQRETSAAMVEHLSFIRGAAEHAVEQVAEAVAEEAADLGIAVADFRVPFSAEDLELDDAEFGGLLRGAQAGVVALRFAGAAGATVFGALAPISLPLAGLVALGAATTSGAVFTIGGRKSGLERRQHAARQATQRFMRDARLVAEKASTDAVIHTQDQLVEEFERLIRELRESVDADLAALAAAEAKHEEEKPALMADLRDVLAQLKLIHSHAQRAIAS